MNPADLRYIVKATILKYLVCSSDISRDHVVMLEYFRNCGQGVFSDEILSQIIEDFPSELTDELLTVLSPPHLRHLKLTNCNRVSCSGLQTTIAKCRQLQVLDFSECIHLLHPVVFCCIKEKATNLVSLSFENSELVSDDIVQVALMCCPGLKHLNISSCKNITDDAFAIPNFKKGTSSTGSTFHTSQPGCSLTSVDISGCHSLSTVAVKHLVSLCGPSLTSVNLAWTGINCVALLYLAGLNMEKVARIMHEAGAISADSALSSNKKTKQELPDHDKWCDGIYDSIKIKASSLMSEENNPTCNESLLNEMEVLILKDVLPMTSDFSQPNSSEKILHVDELNESSDEQSGEELASDTDFMVVSGLSSEMAPSSPVSEQEDSRCSQFLEKEGEECYDVHGHKDFGEKAGDTCTTFCWHIPAKDESLNEEKPKDDTCNRVQLLSVQKDIVSTERKNDIQKNETVTVTKESNRQYEDSFDTESNPVNKIQTVSDQYTCVSGCAVESIAFSSKAECDNVSMPFTVVNGKQPDYPTTLCEVAKDDECARNCPVESSTEMSCDKSVFHNRPCAELVVMDEEVEFKDPRINCVEGEGEKRVFSLIPCVHVEEMENDYSSAACNTSCTVHESSTSSIIPHKNGKGKACWEDRDLLSDCEEEVKQSNHHAMPSGKKEDRSMLDYSLSHRRVIQVSDLLEAQSFQPQITTLDITSIHYQSKPLGEACLKIFSQANKCLKNFAISWLELEDRMLTYLFKNEPELECLSLVDCEKLSNLSLISIPVYCPKLSSFDLKGMCYITDHGLLPLTRSNCLQSLSLAEAAITDCTLESIAKGCGAKLKVLDISWCEDVTDQGMSAVANSCRSLQQLGLRQCAASKLTITTLANNCYRIACLNIAGIDSFTDSALSKLAKNMPILREIDASWNSRLSDDGIKVLLQCCIKLKKVVLCGLKLITSQPFLGIVGDLKRWRLLEELWRYNKRFQSVLPQGKVSLKACDPETAKSLGDQIPCRSMSYSPSLRHMELEYSDKVNDDHLAAIVAVCRGTLFVKDYYGQPVDPKWIFR